MAPLPRQEGPLGLKPGIQQPNSRTLHTALLVKLGLFHPPAEFARVLSVAALSLPEQADELIGSTSRLG